jgi:transglutaminase-like putative cysteine protease
VIPERGPRLLAAEGCLLAVSLVVALGFNRLFSEGGWFLSLGSTVVAAHVLGAVARRLGLAVWLQLVSVAIATMLLMAWLQAPDTLRWFLPTTETLATFGSAFDEALSLYPEARAPTEPIVGFVLAAMVGLAIVATMADIAAFRLGAELQALVPPLTLFLFCSLLGSGQYRVTAAVLFIAVALTFVLLMRALGRRSATTWLPGDDQRGPSTLIRVGTSLTAIAAIAAAIVAPGLPGAEDEGLWTWRGGGGSATRFVISPLVDIRSRLVNQSSEVAFEVESPLPSYWRMLSLDEFEGDQFRLSTSFRAVSRGLGPGVGRSDSTIVEQRFTIEGLASPYLPAAFLPISIDAGRDQVRWDDRSATLLLMADEPPRGFEYVVESVLPDLDPERLRAAPETVLPSIRERYLQLPDDFDPRVAELADSIVEGAATPYDRALMLQNHLRSEYAYSLSVPEGHSESALGRFLFVDRAGYCEQFSAAFAAMARQVGLPSRVAVGFTVGEQMRGSPTRYTVRGEHAHAWPEVWFNGIGWVAFEPTPGRGDPQTQGHTGVEPNQAGDEPGGATTTTTATTQPGGAPFPDLGDMIPDFDTDPGATGAGTGPSGSPGPPRALIWLLAAVATVAGWAALMWAAATGVRTWRRRRAGDDRAARVLVAWDELVAASASLRVQPDPTETHREFARRLSRACRTHPDLVPLASEAAAARFAPVADSPGGSSTSSDDDDLDELLGRFATAVREVQADRTPRRRLVDLVDPRQLLGPRSPRSRRRQARVTSVSFEPADAS